MAKLSARRLTKFRVIFFILGLLVLGVLALQSLLIKDLYARTDQLKLQELKDVLLDANDSLNAEFAIDPQTGRRFIPSARIVFPAKSEAHLYYRAGSESTNFWLLDATNRIQTVSKLRVAPSIEDTFKEVDALQKCGRQLVVSFSSAAPSDSDDKLTLKITKKLKDGRTAYAYLNECPYGSEALLRSVSQMESF